MEKKEEKKGFWHRYSRRSRVVLARVAAQSLRK